MLLAAIVGLAGASDDAFAKELAKIISPQAVVYLRSSIEKANESSAFRFTFLDSKGSVTGELTAPDSLSDILISPDGTLAVASFYGVDIEKDQNICDFVVADKNGFLASFHTDKLCSIKWNGKSLLMYGSQLPLTKWSQDSSGQWTSKKLSDIRSQSLIIDEDHFWVEPSPSEDGKPLSLVELDADGNQVKALPSGVKPHNLLLKFPSTSLVLTYSPDENNSDGTSPQKLAIWDTAAQREQVISRRMRSDVGVWLPKKSLFGFAAQFDPYQDQMAFYSAITGRVETMGPPNLFLPSCAALDDETAIVVAGIDQKQHIMLMTPSTGSVRPLDIRSAPAPDYVAPCR